MTVKGSNGESFNVTGQGQGALNTVLGGLGTASFFGYNANNLLGGMRCGCNNGNNCSCGEDAPVSRYEAGMMLSMNAKDAEIALLKADKYTDQKLVEVTKYIDGKVEALASEVRANKEQQNQINLNQAVYNGTNTAALACLKGQIEQLLSITKLVIPNSSVCPGWGNVTVAPSGAATVSGGA